MLALHNMTFEEAMDKFPTQAGINRYGQPEEIADLMNDWPGSVHPSAMG